MKLEQFDNISEKIINRLNEDYLLLEAGGENDGFTDNVDSMDGAKRLNNAVSAKVGQAEEEAHKAYIVKQNAVNADEHTKDVLAKTQKNKIIKREEAINLKRKLNIQNAELSIDELNDIDIHFLAEEFESDLNEANQQMLKNAEALKETQDKKYEKVQAELAAKEDQLNTKNEQEITELGQSKEELSDNLNKEKEQQKIAISKERDELEKKKAAEEEKNKAKLEKINNIKKTAKEDNGGNIPMVQSNEYYENTKMFKDAQEKQIALEESIKERIKERKIKKANKKYEKAAKAESDIDIKKQEMTKKYGITDENKDDFENLTAPLNGSEHARKKHAKKAMKIKQAYEKLSNKKSEIHKYQKAPADKELQELGEDFDLENEVRVLFEEVDLLLTESEEDENNTVESSENSSLIEKIKKQIHEEETKDNPDQVKIKKLKMKLKEYEKE